MRLSDVPGIEGRREKEECTRGRNEEWRDEWKEERREEKAKEGGKGGREKNRTGQGWTG